MQPISSADIQRRISRDNPWWDSENFQLPEAKFPRRVYFEPFKSLALNFKVKRATILLGPRRVGKTVIIKQLISDAIATGFDRMSIIYASIDTPVYSGIRLETYLNFLPHKSEASQKIVIFDEIQYLRDWESHLKDLVDAYPHVKFVATGSAAAALRLKSRESGAGRFSEFMLPPLTFYEFLCFLDEDSSLVEVVDEKVFKIKNLEKLNTRFIDYLNFGGYPEVVLNQTIQGDLEQFIRNDIIDKVLLKDLPSLYGINEIQELNRLFSFLAYNAGNEASLENISQGSGISKPTIKKYIEYLESAFLIMKLPTVDENARTLTRERNFKIYLNNPSMRAALFSPVKPDETTKIGHLAESAIFSQWQHSVHYRNLRYARWKNQGEVDIVFLTGSTARPFWIGEIKWSDRVIRDAHGETRHMATLIRRHPTIEQAFFTTKTVSATYKIEGIDVAVRPCALHCYIIGRNITSRLENLDTGAGGILSSPS